MSIPPFGAPPLPAQAGNSGKYLTTNGSSSSWGTVAAGGQTLVTKVVAASGGDYTTLGAALTAASSGWTIWVQPGTYTESAISIATTNVTIIGANPESTIISMAANNFALSGLGTRIEGIKFSFSTGTFSQSGNNSELINTHLAWSGTTGSITRSGNDNITTGCQIDTVSITADANVITLSGAHSRFTNNFITFYLGSTAITTGYLKMTAGSQVIMGNDFAVNGGAASAGVVIQATSSGSTISNNVMINGGSNIQAFINDSGGSMAITGNAFTGGITKGIYLNGGQSTVSGNFIQFRSSGNAIEVNTINNVISGNSIRQVSAGSGIGVLVNSTADDTVIVGNRISNFATGISIPSASSDRTTVTGNALNGSTATLSDSGTGTINSGNST